MLTNTVLTLIAIASGVIGVSGFLLRNKYRHRNDDDDEIVTFDILYSIVKKQIVDLVKDDTIYDVGTDEKWESLLRRKKQNRRALKNCVYGIEKDKIIVKNLIKAIIAKVFPEDKIERLLICKNFRASHLDTNTIFEILMQHYKYQGHGADSFKYMMHTYKLDQPKYVIEKGTKKSYLVSEDELDTVYRAERINLDYKIMLDVLTTLIYQKYKGFGCIDTLQEMNLDGVNCGTSGSILQSVQGSTAEQKLMDAYQSVWVMFEGKQIHLRFLDFRTEAELKRVTTLICRYNKPGPLTEKRGFIITTFWNKSRIVAFRPQCSESWAFFMRKFTLPTLDMEYLYNKKKVMEDGTLVPIHKNAQLVMTVLQILMECRVTTVCTGGQGTGKTTLMTSMIRYIDGDLTLRLLELTFEMYLREIYDERNILSLQATQYQTIEELQDALKKSDGAVSAIGEIASNSLIARFIQITMVASLFTIASNHSMTTEDLVYSFRNGVVEEGGFSNDATAEKQVLEVLKVDVHCDKDANGERYIERITEIVKLPENVPYPKYDNKLSASENDYNLREEHYTRLTDRPLFETRDIIKFNKKTRTYEVGKWFTPELTEYMSKTPETDRWKEISMFIKENWGDVTA